MDSSSWTPAFVELTANDCRRQPDDLLDIKIPSLWLSRANVNASVSIVGDFREGKKIKSNGTDRSFARESDRDRMSAIIIIFYGLLFCMLRTRIVDLLFLLSGRRRKVKTFGEEQKR